MDEMDKKFANGKRSDDLVLRCQQPNSEKLLRVHWAVYGRVRFFSCINRRCTFTVTTYDGSGGGR